MVVATSLAVATGGSGCGNDDDQQIRAALSSIHGAYIREDYKGVCAHLTRSVQREIGRIGHGNPTACPRDIAERMSAAILSPRDRVEASVEEVSVDGDRATVTARLGGTTPGTVRLAKEDGEWKLSQLFGTTGPPAEDLR